MDLQQSFHGYAPSQKWLEDRPAVRKNVEERIRPSGGVVELRPIYPVFPVIPVLTKKCYQRRKCRIGPLAKAYHIPNLGILYTWRKKVVNQKFLILRI